MMLATHNDIQWYCIELACGFNDLSLRIANGDYLHDTLCDKSQSGEEKSAWFERWKTALRDEPDGVAGVIRSFRKSYSHSFGSRACN